MLVLVLVIAPLSHQIDHEHDYEGFSQYSKVAAISRTLDAVPLMAVIWEERDGVIRMNVDLNKFVAAAKTARPRVLLTAVALAVVAPITLQRDPVIVLPLVLILGVIVLSLIAGGSRR